MALLFSVHAWAESSLKIIVGKTTKEYTATELLHSPHIKKITLEHDNAYNDETHTYDVISLSAILPGMTTDDAAVVIFHALDGFSAPISEKKILNKNSKESVAYLAIEPPDQHWPLLKPLHPETAGPFRLIWENPELSKITVEEWPYQIASIEVAPSIETQFPDLGPKAAGPAKRGFKIFMRNCFACHKLNGEGEAELGPDLNIPRNPTEYFTPGSLEKLIRDPQNLRQWPKGRMPAFSKENLSDADLHDVIAYLKYLTAHRKK